MGAAQYDKIGSGYDNLTALDSAKLGKLYIEETVTPLIASGKRKTVDLACGTGRFSHALRSFGADSVLGVDVSGAMIDAATASNTDPNVTFLVGDCADPSTRYQEGPFDLALGSWLLNYAPSGDEMAKMFRHAANNLSDDGVFVTLNPHLSEDPAKHIAEALELRPPVKNMVAVMQTGEVEQGVKTKIWAGTEPEPVQFEAYNLRASVYEQAARDGGFRGSMKRIDCTVPDLAKQRGECKGAWDAYGTVPHATILVAAKN